MQLLQGTRFWQPQLFGFIGAFCVLLGVFGPAVQIRATTGFDPFRGVQSISSLIGSPDFLEKACGFAIVVIGGGIVWAAGTLQFELLKKITLGLAGAIGIATCLCLWKMFGLNGLSPLSLLPIYVSPVSGACSFGWGWYLLLAAAGLSWKASTLVEEPTEAEREKLIQPRRSTTAAATPAKALIAAITPAQQLGTCSACKAQNSMQERFCHSCNAVLPWETARYQEQLKRQKQAAIVPEPQFIAGSRIVVRYAWLGLIYLLVFLFSCFPFTGYFFWKYLDNEDSPYAGTAFVGCILGGLFFIGGFLLRLVAGMARVGSMD